MLYRLGIDLGTSSVGIVATSLENKKPSGIVYGAVRIFDEPLEPPKSGGVGMPKKANRRTIRQSRRQTARRAQRLVRVAQFAPHFGLDAATIPPDKGQKIIGLRAAAADSKIPLDDFFRVLLHMEKRRGYMGIFRVINKARRKKKSTTEESPQQNKAAEEKRAKEKRQVKKGIDTLKQTMSEYQTLGQYLLSRQQQDPPLHCRLKDDGLYADVAMVLHEFAVIWQEQQKHHAVLQNDDLRRQVEDAVFFKMPMKSPAAMVGNCLLDPLLPRAAKAQPLAQAFRIEKQLADLRYGQGRNYQPLTTAQKEIVRDLLHQQKEAQFSTIRKTLSEQGHPLPKDAKIKFENGGRETLKGDTTMAAIRSLELDQEWQNLAQPFAIDKIEKQLADLRYGEEQCLTKEQKEIVLDLLLEKQKDIIRGSLYGAKVEFSTIKSVLAGKGHSLPENAEIKFKNSKQKTLNLAPEYQTQVINLLADMGEPDIFDNGDWHEKLHCAKQKDKKRVIPEETVKFINTMKQTGKFDRLSKMGFDSGRGSYSLKTLNILVEAMRTENLDEYGAIAKHYPAHTTPQADADGRTIPPPRTGNTVIDVALRQFAREIYKVVDKMGGFPQEIIVEMSRDMRLGLKQRNQIIAKINSNKKKRDNAREEIKRLVPHPTETDIRRYLLWDEQQKKCPYCGTPITLGEALDGNSTHHEHILPRALTRIGKNRDYLVLAHAACNYEKGKRTPYQAWGHDTERWRIIEEIAAQYKEKKMFGKAKQLLYTDDEHLDDDAISGFSARQFQETSWIAKIATKWLKEAFPNADISVSRGVLTAHFRKIWGLDTIIPELRYAEGLPVLLREDGKTAKDVPQEEFRHISKRQIDKRIDHRHHLIDAAVVCMTSRSLYQMMEKNYKQASDQASDPEKIKLYLCPESPIPTVRKELRDLAKNEEVISHRPDRYVGGALFKDTAYAVINTGEVTHARLFEAKKDSKLAYAKREVLTDWADSGSKKNDTVEKVDKITKKVRSKIERILCDSTREAVSAAFEGGIQSGKKPSECLQDIKHPHQKTKIRRVLVDTNINADNTVKVIHHGRINRKGKSEKTQLHKHLMPDGYAYLEVWKNDKGELQKKLVPTHEALKNKGKPKNGVQRFYKKDTVLYENTLYVVRQIKSEGSGTLILQRVQDARPIKSYVTGTSSGKKQLSRLTELAKLSLVPDRK